MPLSDLLGKRARTASGVEVAPPTVRSFFRALEVFGAEIGIVREASRSVSGGLGIDLSVALFLATPNDGRLEYVLGTNDPDAVRSVAEMIVPIARQIDAFLAPPDAEIDPDAESDDVDPASFFVLGVASKFSSSPIEILERWPIGLFLSAHKMLTAPPKRDNRALDAITGIVGDAPSVPIVGGPSYPARA